MKGLLIKDFKLTLKQKSSLLIIVVLAVFMAAAAEDASYIISYLSLVGSLFTLSSVSYDEFDNGNLFLFSLPFTRKEYVLEKYGFGIILGGGFWLLASLLGILSQFIKSQTIPGHTLAVAVGTLPAVFIILALSLPIQLKYGAEKGRIALLGLFGVIVIFGLVGPKFSDMLGFDLAGIINRAALLNPQMLSAAILSLSVLLLLLSCKISIRIVMKKDF